MINPDSKGYGHTMRRVALCVLLGGVALTPALADDVDVRITGIANPLLGNVRKSLSVAAKHKEAWTPEQIQRLYRLAPKEIDAALQPYGYFNATVKPELTPPAGVARAVGDSGDKNDASDAQKKSDQTWQASFSIDHGPATMLTTLNLSARGPGDHIDGVQDALKDSQLRTGKRLIQSQYTATKTALYQAAYQAGYLDADFSQSAIKVNPKTNTAEIDLVLNTGERYYFGPVTFDQDLLNDQFVHRFVPFKTGQPFDAQKLIDLQLSLTDTDYYSQVAIQANRSEADRSPDVDHWLFDLLFPPEDPLESIGRLEVPVTVKAEPSKSQSYKVSAGYGTDTGPRIGLGVKFRHLNQYGHQFKTDLLVSQVQRSLLASYDIPIQNVASDKLSFTGEITNEDYGDITSTRYGIGAVRDVGWKYGRRRAYLDLYREYYDIGNGNQVSTLLYPGYTFTLQKADNILFTHKGVSLSLDVHGGSDALLSSTNFAQADFAAHVVLPVTHKVRVLLRSELGATAVSDFSDLPPSQRFFAGGSRSVRGYSYQSISPVNDDNEDVGGRYLATGSVEGNYFFYKNFGVATFFDAGDASDSASFDFKKSAGVGFRWASPVGMVRLDVSHPFDDPHSDIGVDFSLGPDL